jgi:murein DD-endopeptidase MepM/ murein hydrolase activator NlpD
MNKYSYYLIILFLCAICSCTSKTNKQNTLVEAKIDTVSIADANVPEPVQSDSIRKYSRLLKDFFIEAEPAERVSEWLLPFDLPDRSNIDNITFISGYGAYRSTRVKGHKHSGIDIVPANKKRNLDVYAVAKGVVCFVNQEAPFKTVIIKHKLNDGSVVYSSYIHLKEIFTERGKQVNESTKIGALYTRPEALKYGGNFDHLHFEIKKRIDDYSCASWLCMNNEELNEYFINPVIFLKTKLKQ